jgi:PAS domain S-box-containing protein
MMPVMTINDSRDRPDPIAAGRETETGERLREVLEHSLDAVYKRNLRTDTYEYMSPAFVNISGYSPEEMESLPVETVLDLMHPDDEEGVRRVIAASASPFASATHELEYRFRHKDGRYRWLHDRFTVLRDGSGEAMARIGSVRDITDRKLAEEALEESEANFRSFFDSITDMIMASGSDGRITYANAAVTDTLGYSQAELQGMKLLDLYPSDRKEDAQRHLTAIFDGGTERCHIPLTRRDGRLIPVETRVSRSRWKGVDYVFGISRNLTEEQEALLRFERLFRNNPALMALSSLPDRRFCDVNDAFLKTLGYSRGEIIGKTIPEIGLFPVTAEKSSIADRLQTEGQIKDIELQIRCKNGEQRDGLFSGEVIDIQGTRYFLTVMSDITERKRAEEEVRVLTSRIIQAQRLEALEVLVAGFAHNLNNVLASIMAANSVHENRAGGEQDLETCSSIEAACKRGRDVIQSLMRFSRQVIDNQVSLDLNALVHDCRSRLDLASMDRIRIIEEVSAEGAWISGDSVSLGQAIANICDNAKDAMPDGGILTIHTGCPERDWVEISISDTGRGMSPEVMEHAQVPFFTTKKVGEGLGLGFSMAYGTVKAHGGYLDVSSEPGHGTCVKIRLPRIPAPPRKKTLTTSASPFWPSKVLLVDDDGDIRFFVGMMLKSAGMDIDSVPGGEEALQSLRSGNIPDLVILDQNMPRMNGVQTLEHIQATWPNLPVLISSGQPYIHEWACFKKPNVSVISKPFDLRELKAVLDRFIVN